MCATARPACESSAFGTFASSGDIAAFELGGERFDYIVCHGVYSWVPPSVRDAILRISAHNLAEGGIAYVSYNVYPG